MNLKEHLQFLIMMIPTLLLLVAAVVTLAAPAHAAQPRPGIGQHEVAVLPAKIDPAQAVAVR